MTADVVARAREWVGTPYLHQSSVKGAGCDCLGLLRGLWREQYETEPELVPAYTADWGEADGSELLWQAARRHLVDVSQDSWQAGQVLLFRMREGAIAKHVGLLTEVGDTPRFLHAYTGHGVIENSLSRPWRRRVVARFRFPGEA